jgi:uncharacterized protein YbjT (DUF2867 family)
MTTAVIGATGRVGSDVAEAFDGIRLVFIVMGSIGIEGVLQRIAINVAARIFSIEQVTRLSILNTLADAPAPADAFIWPRFQETLR